MIVNFNSRVSIYSNYSILNQAVPNMTEIYHNVMAMVQMLLSYANTLKQHKNANN